MIPAALAAMGAPIAPMVMPPRVTVSEPAENVGPLPEPPTVRTTDLGPVDVLLVIKAGTMKDGVTLGARKPMG